MPHPPTQFGVVGMAQVGNEHPTASVNYEHIRAEVHNVFAAATPEITLSTGYELTINDDLYLHDTTIYVVPGEDSGINSNLLNVNLLNGGLGAYAELFTVQVGVGPYDPAILTDVISSSYSKTADPDSLAVVDTFAKGITTDIAETVTATDDVTLSLLYGANLNGEVLNNNYMNQ